LAWWSRTPVSYPQSARHGLDLRRCWSPRTVSPFNAGLEDPEDPHLGEILFLSGGCLPPPFLGGLGRRGRRRWRAHGLDQLGQVLLDLPLAGITSGSAVGNLEAGVT